MTETAVQGDQPLIIEPGPNVANKAVGIVIDNPAKRLKCSLPRPTCIQSVHGNPKKEAFMAFIATQEEERNLEEEERSFRKTSQFSELMKNSKRACWGHARKNGRNGNNSTQQKIYRTSRGAHTARVSMCTTIVKHGQRQTRTNRCEHRENMLNLFTRQNV